jgi:hypothetical protein
MTSGEPALADDLNAEDRLDAIGPPAAAALAVPEPAVVAPEGLQARLDRARPEAQRGHPTWRAQ